MDYTYLDTPIGELLLAGDRRVLRELGFPDGPKRRRAESHWELRDAIFTEAKAQLNRYFSGALKEFSLPLDPRGTPFQLSVLEELKKIDGILWRDCCTSWRCVPSARQTAEIQFP